MVVKPETGLTDRSKFGTSDLAASDLTCYSGYMRNKRRGYSMIEVLVVVAIISLLFIIALQMMIPQISKSRDAHRKGDLDRVKVALENYFSDNGCYPDPAILSSCNGDQLSPYIPAVPCDPLDNSPYVYIPAPGNQCGGYKVLAKMENRSDPVISELKCMAGCGGIGASDPAYDQRFNYNYGVSVGIPVSEYSDLTQGIICEGGTTCKSCEISGGGCDRFPMVFPDVTSCLASGCN